MDANLLTKKPGIIIPWMILFSFIIFTVGILVLGRVYYNSQKTRINQDAQESLTAIANLKIKQIEQWRIERLGNAEQIRNNNPLLKCLKDYILNVNQPEAETDIKKWTDYMAQKLDYNGVFIFDTLLKSRFAARQSVSVLPEASKIVCREVLQDMNVRMTDLYRNGPSSQPAIDIVIPLVLNSKKQSRPFGVIVLRIDPAKTLFPLIKSWPTPSKSAETLLIRKDRDSVLYLNDLRHIQNTALILRLPLSDKNLPAAKAVNGFIGVVEGVDYRKVPVVGYTSSVPGMNWFMVAKIDKQEIQAPLKRFSFISVFVTILLILIVASVLLFWIRNQQFMLTREHLRNELSRKQLDELLIISESRYRRLFEAARDGILILEAETGLIVDVNPYLVEMLGVTREQFLKKAIWEIGFFKDVAANKGKFLELQQKEYVRYEDLPLEAADGRKFYVEFVSNVYLVNDLPVIQCNIRDISIRKEMEDALREWNNQFKKLSYNAPGMIFQFTKRPDGTYCVPITSDGIKNIYGLTSEDVIDDFSPIAKVILPEDLERVVRAIEYSAEHLTLFDCDFRAQIPGKPFKWLNTKSTPEKLENGSVTWYGFISDITDRKKVEQSIINSEKNFKELLESLPQLFWKTRVDGPCDYLSRQWVEYTGVPEADQLGYRWLEQLHTEDKDRMVTEWTEKVKTRESFDIEFRIRRNDGIYHWFRTRAVPMYDSDGFIIKWLGSSTDIDDIKNAADKLSNFNKMLEQKVNQRTEQLEDANKELEAFSYSVSHDLRAPLRAVNSFTNILLEDYEKLLDDEGKRICGIISSGATQMGELIDDLLSFSRIGRSAVNPSMLNMKTIACSVYEELNNGNADEKTTVKIGKLHSAFGDANLLKIVWTNLISNAIKYSSKRSASEIAISSSQDDHTITYSVKDNGVGFDMQYIHKLFGVFQRLHSESEFEGNGVGLAIVQRIINKHGGKVWAEGEMDNGATFFFSLPVPEVNKKTHDARLTTNG